MDPAIEEKWQAAVMPVALGVIEGYEVSEQGKVEARERLKELGVPTGTIELRQYLLERIAGGHRPFLPMFAIRAEVALAGIGCLYELPDDRREAHQRVLVRFFTLAIAPITEWIDASDDPGKRQEYDTLLAFDRFLNSDIGADAPESWSAALNRLEQQALSHQPRTPADFLAFWCVRLLRPSDTMEDGLINRFVYQLGTEYRYCYEEEGSQAERIARTFLAALESQCPEPEWLQRYNF